MKKIPKKEIESMNMTSWNKFTESELFKQSQSLQIGEGLSVKTDDWVGRGTPNSSYFNVRMKHTHNPRRFSCKKLNDGKNYLIIRKQ